MTERIIHGVAVCRALSSIRTRTFRNISYIGLAQITVLILTFVMITVLARLLTPEDFGIASIGIILMALFATVQDFGITQAVIQRDTRVEESVAVGLSIRWMIAAVLLVTIVLLSDPISDFYDNAAVAPVLIVMSANLFVQPVAFPSLVMLSRGLQFRRLAVGTVAQYGTMSFMSIGLALAGFSYWSIVFGSLAGSAAYVVTLRYYQTARVRPMMDRGLAKDLLGFGTHLLVAGLMAYVIFNIDQLVIGKVLGVAVLGVYFIAVRFGRTLGEQISGTVNKVLFPTMARMKDSLDHLRVGYTESLRMIAVITIPLSVGMAALSPMFVPVVLGDGWAATVFPITILSMQGLLNALIPPAASVLAAIGKPKYMSIQASAQAAMMIVLVYPVASHFGIDGVCVLTTVLSLAVFGYFILVFRNVFDSSPTEIIRPMVPAAASGAATFAFLAFAVDSVNDSAFWLVALSVAGACLYLVCLHVTSRGRDIRDLLRLVKGAIKG
jgi:O-antigen/teichoic acid export membrane protein